MANHMNLMKKALELEVDMAWRKEFKQLKSELTAGKIKAYPDFNSNEPFILTMDWSALNIAGILSLKQDGVEHFISCWGR